ncbi:Restriction endonuclease [Onishia taeanensis]|uniref:Restriction endonuclease n=1 Tax=Onishia taeanensis TaxID=284577 RepID=A0A1G7NEM1_9GAMM|nr:restriction endonuclease [Halomonas taeanensis]SDF72371.1 Restriction endonuclease [Halomonas taeanensis]
MPHYDFKQLSPNDFENLSRDLIQERDNIELESFKTGRDQGIDFRHSHADGDIIVQCKHYAGTGFSGLISSLIKEAEKIEQTRININRYILTTSVGLTPANKSKIQDIFGSKIKSGDIIGADDLNNLLGKYPSIERKYYKLWLASRAVLDRVIHNNSITQSEFEIYRIHRDIQRYVMSNAYPKALHMLDSERVVIISGVPGVGKTSLAKMLLYAHLERGYEIISIMNDFQTGRERYQRDKKQIFYFDDFMGATFLGERATEFTRNEDRAILDFIDMVQSSPSARLVMTTREHILRQAIATSEKLKHSNIIDSRFVLEIGAYSLKQRAEILYNHIYFSQLPKGYRSALLANKFYKEIVTHNKFNPRLIEWLSTFQRIKSIDPQNYQDFVRNLLADPAEIWRHAYEQQISDAGRSVLLSLYTYSGTCDPTNLEQAFNKLHYLRAQRYGFSTEPSNWRRALHELNGSFIHPGEKIKVIDPSVLDMLNSVIRQDTLNAVDMIEGAIDFKQANKIIKFSLNPENENILRQLSTNESKVANSLERLFNDRKKPSPNYGGLIFYSNIERIITTIIETAERLQSGVICELARSKIDATIDELTSNSFDVDGGIVLLNTVSNSTLTFANKKEELQSKISKAIIEEAMKVCSSNEIENLLETTPFEKESNELHDEIENLIDTYRDEFFYDELKDCNSTSDYETLKASLSTIADKSGFDFSPEFQSITEKISEIEEHEMAYEDHMYEAWKETRHDRKNKDQGLDDLFDSLLD